MEGQILGLSSLKLSRSLHRDIELAKVDLRQVDSPSQLFLKYKFVIGLDVGEGGEVKLVDNEHDVKIFRDVEIVLGLLSGVALLFLAEGFYLIDGIVGDEDGILFFVSYPLVAGEI